MSAISELIEGIKRTDALLSAADLEPRAERTDWAGAKKKVAALRAAIDEDILPLLPKATEEAEGELATMIHRRTAHLLADAAAVFHAAGEGLQVASMLAKAERMTPDDEHKRELVAAQKEPAVFARLCLARWLLGDGRFDDGDREAKRVRRETKQPVFAERAKKLLSGSRPLKGGPPSLFTLNGFGTGLYGSRDHDAEGSYVATYCVCFLFVPVFPLAAYRVKRVSATTYRFFAKEQLSGFARGFQALVGIAAVAGITGAAVQSYLHSPEHRSEVALEEARAAETAGDGERAMEGYHRLVDQFSPSSGGVKGAVAGIARLATKDIPAPCTGAAVEPARRAANAFVSLPASAREGVPVTELAKRLDACATEIGDTDADHARAALRVLDLASDVAKSSDDARWVEQRRGGARRAFAVKMADSRPLLALAELAKLEDQESVDAAKKIVLSFGEAPSLWIEAEADIERWADHARGVNDAAAARDAKDKLAAAHKLHDESEKLVAAGDEKALAKAAAEHPGDQELSAALAGQKRSHGDGKGAIELLTRLGAPGRLTATAQDLLANTYAESGDLAKADELLSALVDERLPAFQDAQRAFYDAASAAEKKVTADLRLGILAPDLERRMQGITDEGKQREEVQAWVSEKLDGDPTLLNVRTEYLRRGQTVPASLSLGMIKLRRAADAHGDERKRLLAEAERAFVAIRREASGDPSFHLGLGQVYFRLGKPEEGERELAGVLERNTPELTLAVARTYRELGLDSRARQVAKTVYDTAAEPGPRHTAADLLAHLANGLDEEESWLQKADPLQPSVRVSLDRVQGERLLRDGKSAEADQKFQKCVAFFDRDAKNNAVSANNAATETMRRYGATGDPAHLQKAVNYLEASAKLEPDNAIVLSNLSSSLGLLGSVTVLGKWIDMRALILEERTVRSVAGSMLEGPAASEILEALRKDPSYQRSLDVSQKQQILAPQMFGAYQPQLTWYGWTRDDSALEELKKRVDTLPISPDTNADLREKWRSGERDEQGTRDAKDSVASARRRIERVKSSSKPTQAVAWLTLTEALQSLVFFERDAKLIDEMVEAARKAQSLWPEGVARGDVVAPLFAAAFYRTTDASPALKKLWEAERRKHSAMVVAYMAVTGEGGADIAGVLRKDPALTEAASLRRQALTDRPTLSDFLLGRISGHEELEHAAEKAFDRKEIAIGLAIDEKLDPGDEDTLFSLKLLKTRGAAK
jgi:hypothetical protein